MDCHQADAAEQAARRSACNDRRVLNGTFWVLRSGAPWRDLPTYGPRTTLQSLRSAGVWDQIMDALAAGACPRWVGDVHQPLHVSFEDDRGGNGALVMGKCGTSNLHSAWDTCLVLKAAGDDVGEAATDLMRSITPARIESWNHSNPMDWANESFAIAEQARTEYCIRQGASCDHPSGKVKIDAAYVAVNTPIIREQLQKAGVRLAHMLDAALGK